MAQKGFNLEKEITIDIEQCDVPAMAKSILTGIRNGVLEDKFGWVKRVAPVEVLA